MLPFSPEDNTGAMFQEDLDRLYRPKEEEKEEQEEEQEN